MNEPNEALIALENTIKTFNEVLFKAGRDLNPEVGRLAAQIAQANISNYSVWLQEEAKKLKDQKK